MGTRTSPEQSKLVAAAVTRMVTGVIASDRRERSPGPATAEPGQGNLPLRKKQKIASPAPAG
jgi:hypothetical protein